MKYLRLPALGLALLAMAASANVWAQSAQERASQVLDQLEAGQFEDIAATFDPQMQAAVDANALEQGWNSLPQQVGPLQSRGEPTATTQGEHEVVIVPLQYQHATINATIAFDGEGRLSGLLLQPAQAQPAPAPAQAPEPAEPAH